MEDWIAGLGILLCAVVWVQVFLDYRGNMAQVQPRLVEVNMEKGQMDHKIQVAQNHIKEATETRERLAAETERLENERQRLQHRLNLKDMVLIPASVFMMGNDVDGNEDEQPIHQVQLGPYYLDRFEVTNEEYRDFIIATGYKVPVHWRNGSYPETRLARHPVVNVTWEDARTYAAWMGKRLPTEAEWEVAACGTDEQDYPWGNTAQHACANYDNPDKKTSRVDAFPNGKSPYGIWDMCGNVGEWVQDWYDPEYYEKSPEADPAGPEIGSHRCYRGGGFHGNKVDIRASNRHFDLPDTFKEYIGFRCAMSAKEKAAEE